MSSILKAKRIPAILVVIFLLVSITACGGKSNTSGTTNSTAATTTAQTTAVPSTTAVAKEPVTLKIWMENFNTPGVQNNPVANELAKQTGVTMDIVTGDTEKFKVLVAGNDLPDIIQLSDTTLVSKSGQLLQLDSLIDQYGVNMKTIFPKRLEYSKRFLSDGTNGIYLLPTEFYLSNPDHPDISRMGASQGFFLRWDIYAKVGYPEIKNYDDFINVLKQMQDAYPKTADGKKVYAISGWNDWSYLWPWHISSIYSEGMGDYPNDFYFDYPAEKASPMFADSRFWASIEFNNKAYRAGLLDPEAFTMKYANFTDKCKAGQILVCYASWQAEGFNNNLTAAGHPDQGYEYVMTGFPYVAGVITPDSPIGWGQAYSIAVSKNCKTPDRAVQFIDYIFGYDGSRLLLSGVKGKHWDIVDGKPQATQERLNGSLADKNYNDKEGLNYGILAGMQGQQVAPDGFPLNVANDDQQKASKNSDIDKAFIQHYGSQYLYPGQVVYDFVQQGKIKTITKYSPEADLVGQPSDDTKKLLSQVEEYMKVQIAKVIMAKTEAEFKTMKQKTLDDIKAKGFSKAFQEIQGLFDKAKQDLGTFSAY
jgi:ABC-type sugar transport system, periplasmic component